MARFEKLKLGAVKACKISFTFLNISGEIHSLKIEVLEGQISFDSLIIKP